jgi:hypothetical protein
LIIDESCSSRLASPSYIATKVMIFLVFICAEFIGNKVRYL